MPSNKVPIAAFFVTIEKKTGKTPEDFKALATEQGYYEDGEMKVKAREFGAWLKKDFDLGQGHSLALFHYVKGDL